MSGPRDTGWTHTRLVGDRDRARELIPVARKLLGYARQQAGGLSLQTYKVSKTLPGGEHITAELHGGIPRITIEVAPAKAPPKPPLAAAGFVVWARTDGLPDGIDPEFPQQVLAENGNDWTARVKSRDIAEGRRDGTYGAKFPDGLTRAGNVDWEGADGERISWYGPSSRMFMDAYINPAAMFGKFVFMMGKPLLDVDAYIADSTEDTPFDDRWIVGAAIKKIGGERWLYCIQSGADDGETDMTTIPGGGGRFTYPLAPQSIIGGLHRYRLDWEVDPAGIPRYTVRLNSREKLVPINLGHADPWFFNRSCSQVVCHSALPASHGGTPWWVAKVIDPDNPPDGTDDTEEYLPAAAQTRTRLAIADDGTVTLLDQLAFSVNSTGPASPVASDYFEDELRSIAIRMDSELAVSIVFDGVELPLWRCTEASGVVSEVKRNVLYASPRDNLMVFLAEQREVDVLPITPETIDATVAVEIWRGGVLAEAIVLFQHPDEIPDFGLQRTLIPNSRTMNDLAGVNISPAYFIYGLVSAQVNTGGVGPGSFSTNDTFLGAVNTFALLPYPSECWFGTYDRRVTDPADRPPTPFADLAENGASGNKADFDGHFSVTGCAASPESTLLSCAVPVKDQDGVAHHISRTTFALATGISGPGERYHPIWLLGKPPKD